LPFIKASFVILSALFSSLVILWMGAQTRPVHGSWSFSPFWDSLPLALVASSAMLGAGTRFAIPSKQWSVALTCVDLALARVGPPGHVRILYIRKAAHTPSEAIKLIRGRGGGSPPSASCLPLTGLEWRHTVSTNERVAAERV
jgi:hypothetical protein